MSNNTKPNVAKTQRGQRANHNIISLGLTFCLVSFLTMGLPVCARAQQWTDSVRIYTQGARMGDLHSIERLAECYHWGRGVERNLLNVMFLFEQAHDFGGETSDWYFNQMAPDDEMRLIHDAQADLDNRRKSDFEVKLEKLRALKSPSVVTLEAIRNGALRRPGEKSIKIFRSAAQDGCVLAPMMMMLVLDVNEEQDRFIEGMTDLASSVPMAYNTLGFLYYGASYDGSEATDVAKALECFAMADKYGILSRANARRLLTHYRNEMKAGRRPCSDDEIKRLEKLALPDWVLEQ